MTPQNAFPLTTVVYQRLCPENAGVVTAHIVRKSGITLLIRWANLDEDEHEAWEVTDERGFQTERD